MTQSPPKRNRAIVLSNLLFALTLIVAGIMVYLYFFDNHFFKESPPPPACEAGRNELICVVDALKAHDLDRVELGRYTASSNQLSQPGQVIVVNDLNGFLFVYPSASGAEGVAAREADAANLDPATMLITARTSERPLNEGEETHVFQHSNIIFVLVGGTDSEISNIEAAINSLP